VPPDESVATPVAPKNENPRTATETMEAVSAEAGIKEMALGQYRTLHHPR